MTFTFRIERDGRTFEVTGQTARALLALVAAGSRGVTAAEMSSWALRLAHYVLCLRRLGLEIPMEREPHSGGWHGRYRLETPVRIVAACDPESEAAA